MKQVSRTAQELVTPREGRITAGWAGLISQRGTTLTSSGQWAWLVPHGGKSLPPNRSILGDEIPQLWIFLYQTLKSVGILQTTRITRIKQLLYLYIYMCI